MFVYWSHGDLSNSLGLSQLFADCQSGVLRLSWLEKKMMVVSTVMCKGAGPKLKAERKEWGFPADYLDLVNLLWISKTDLLNLNPQKLRQYRRGGGDYCIYWRQEKHGHPCVYDTGPWASLPPKFSCMKGIKHLGQRLVSSLQISQLSLKVNIILEAS